MTATRHPRWCDRVRCTAKPGPPSDGHTSPLREHLSDPVPLHIRVVHGQVVADPSGGDVIPQLCRAVPPWRCETFLRISDTGPGGQDLEMPLALAAALADQLGGLIGTGAADAAPGQERPPPLSLVPDLGAGPGGDGE